jgi:hypothetical protein
MTQPKYSLGQIVNIPKEKIRGAMIVGVEMAINIVQENIAELRKDINDWQYRIVSNYDVDNDGVDGICDWGWFFEHLIESEETV